MLLAVTAFAAADDFRDRMAIVGPGDFHSVIPEGKEDAIIDVQLPAKSHFPMCQLTNELFQKENPQRPFQQELQELSTNGKRPKQ